MAPACTSTTTDRGRPRRQFPIIRQQWPIIERRIVALVTINTLDRLF
jgi:hypothetical protein